MSLIVATLVVGGALTAIGIGGGIWYASTEDDRARERIKQLEAENESLNFAVDYVSNINNKLNSAKDYLNQAKKDFQNGGHVLDGVPLADTEFTSCINKINGAITNATNLINDFNATIEQNKKEISKEQEKLK